MLKKEYIIVHLLPHHSTNPILQLFMLLSLFHLPGCFRVRNICPIIVTISVSLIPLYLVTVQVLIIQVEVFFDESFSDNKIEVFQSRMSFLFLSFNDSSELSLLQGWFKGCRTLIS